MKLWLNQLWWELAKLLRRRRTYLGFAAFLVFEIALLVLLQREDVVSVLRRQVLKAGYTFQENFSGPTVAHFILGYTISVIGSLYVALVCGDVVAKEVEDGTMRMLLCQPVSRRRILGVKLAVCLVYATALTVFIAVSALLLGLAAVGRGQLFVFNMKENIVESHAFAEGLRIYLFEAMPLLAVSMWTVAVLAFALSCLRIKPVAATVGALSVIFIDEMLRGISFFENVRHFFLTNRMASWVRVYRQPMRWGQVCEDYALLLALDVIVIVIGFWVFSRRDLKP
jgi:ABC-2 type transport system permease protein